MTLTPTLPTFAAPTDTERATLAAILNHTGLRATAPRINVLHYLNATDTPVTAEMISRFVDLPLSTAYRTLTALEITHLAGVTFGRGDVTRWFRFTPDTPQHCPACGQSFYSEYS
ncbi:TPA: helix-turn-helix domain-containing protein [Klebsiella pneumoniae]|uniref:helix-turn-helix domain-containing protein n=1 Tax=Klebsiella pneumoniae TaxID=573 RepID=UPI000812ED2C